MIAQVTGCGQGQMSHPACGNSLLRLGVKAVGEVLVFDGVADEARRQSQNRLATDCIAARLCKGRKGGASSAGRERQLVMSGNQTRR